MELVYSLHVDTNIFLYDDRVDMGMCNRYCIVQRVTCVMVDRLRSLR
jgi:hypothetical protein